MKTNVRVTYNYPPAVVESGAYPATVVDEFQMEGVAELVKTDNIFPLIKRDYKRLMFADHATVEFAGRKVTIKDRYRSTPYEA